MQVSTQMGPFSIVPEWVLEKPLSPTSLRLYCVLARFADWETGIAFPSRDTLAQRMGCSGKTIDRAVSELVAMGCIIKISRGRYQSAQYKVLQVNPEGTDLSELETDLSGEGTDLSEREDKNDTITITTEQEPLELEPLKESSRQNRETRLPENWQPSQRLMDMFDTKWPNLDPDYEVEQFINYWLSVNTRKADWDRTFQVWMSKNQKDADKRGLVRGKRLTNNEQAALLAMKYREQYAQAELEPSDNPKLAREIESEVSNWMKGVDDV